MTGNGEAKTMVRRCFWGVMVLIAVGALVGCSATPQTPVNSAVIAVSAQAPQQQNALVGTAFGSVLTAMVTSNGTPVSGQTVTFTVQPSSGGASAAFANGTTATTAATDGTGVATATALTANNLTGTYLVVASVAAATSTGLFDMANVLQPGPIAVAGGTPQSATLGMSFNTTLSVNVTDASAKPVGANLPVTFTAPAGSGTFVDTDANVTTALTNSSGVATSAAFAAAAGTTPTGPYTVTATTGYGDSASVSFTLSNTIQPNAVATTSGSGQSAAAGAPFALPLTATVTDSKGNPVANAVVAFSAPSFTVTSGTPSAASGTFANGKTAETDWTDANGVATSSTFTANALAGGPYNVSATVAVGGGNNVSVNFSLTNN